MQQNLKEFLEKTEESEYRKEIEDKTFICIKRDTIRRTARKHF